MRDTPWRTQRAPFLGEHNEQVLGQLLEMDKSELSALHERGVV